MFTVLPPTLTADVQESVYTHVCVSRSVVSDSATPWTVGHQASLSMESLH